MDELDTTAEPMPTKTSRIAAGAKIATELVKTGLMKVVTLMTEVAVVAYLGSLVGIYYTSKSVQEDCKTVNIAKVGDAYMQCTLVVPKKDSEVMPPR